MAELQTAEKNNTAVRPWHQCEPSDVLRLLGTELQTGLNEPEIKKRLQKFGPNELAEKGGKSPWKILWEQLTATMVVILISAAGISALLKDYHDAIAILAIVVLNAVLGFSQEYRAEKSLAALKKLTVPSVRVRRSGRVREISSKELVPGDIVFLDAGNLVPADGRLIESVNLRAQESALTGESEPVEKEIPALSAPGLPIGDRRNMVYQGTVVTYGRGTAVVTETGMRTELGRIASLIQTAVQELTPLQKRLDRMGKQLAELALAIVAVVFILGLLRGVEVRLMFLTAVSLAVAAIPEGLPAVVTIALALGSQRLLKRKALIRKLPAVETLGSVSVICSDKTGTLTQNQMSVSKLYAVGRSVDFTDEDGRKKLDFKNLPEGGLSLFILLSGSALCNDAKLDNAENRLSFIGDPTEGALLAAAVRAGMEVGELEQNFPRVGEIPFDSNRKRMTTVHRLPSQNSDLMEIMKLFLPDPPEKNKNFIAFTKGAADGLLENSSSVWNKDHVEPLTEKRKEELLLANQDFAKSGMRVLGLGFKWMGSAAIGPGQEQELVFAGLICMMDPPRPEARSAVQNCKTAGIQPIMITGDHPLTALSIARQLGITTNGEVMTGRELEKVTVQELEKIVDRVFVYARVSPEHKLKIVQALQNLGHSVAMTGDGVNDAPALKKANIGVAMGLTGTDVSKEASDMVLLDDNFATIVAAVEEGRTIYDNIRKFIKYLLTTNSAEILVMLLGPFIGIPLPLLPLQILWINLVTDGLPALALSLEPPERNAMRRAPTKTEKGLLSDGVIGYVIGLGLLMTLVTLGAGTWYWRSGQENWQTMVFTVLALSQMAQVLAIRSDRDSLFTIGLFSNPWLLGAVGITVALQLAVIYLPFLARIFKTVPLSLPDLAVAFALSTIVFWAIELKKRIDFLREKDRGN